MDSQPDDLQPPVADEQSGSPGPSEEHLSEAQWNTIRKAFKNKEEVKCLSAVSVCVRVCVWVCVCVHACVCQCHCPCQLIILPQNCSLTFKSYTGFKYHVTRCIEVRFITC